MRLGMLWRIRADMRNQGYDLPDWVGKTLYRCIYTADRGSYQLYRGWLIDSHTKFSKSQFLMMVSPISSHLSRSRPQVYHHLRTRSYVIALNLSMPWSRVNTKNSLHWIQHTPSTAYTAYCIHRVLHTLRTASSQDPLSPAPSQSLISRRTMLYSILHIPTITS